MAPLGRTPPSAGGQVGYVDAVPCQRVLVTGASGYIGGRLVPELLDAGYRVRCLVRTPAKLDDAPWSTGSRWCRATSPTATRSRAAMAGVDAAYYLVHSMGGVERLGGARPARRPRRSGTRPPTPGVGRIVYLGGLGATTTRAALARTCASRHEVGRVLADGPVPVTELRAAVIIGSGSASFEMLRYLVEVLPVMVAPKWVETRCQPIAVRDVLRLPRRRARPSRRAAGRVLEVGGPDVVHATAEMMQHLRRGGRAAAAPHRAGAGPVAEAVVAVGRAGHAAAAPAGPAAGREPGQRGGRRRPADQRRSSTTGRCSYREAVRAGARPHADREVLDELGRRRAPGHHARPTRCRPTRLGRRHGARPTCEEPTADASADAVFRTVEGIGGETRLVQRRAAVGIRGLVDKLVGGVGMRRGRRDPDRMRVGDAVDFWRVEALEPDRAGAPARRDEAARRGVARVAHRARGAGRARPAHHAPPAGDLPPARAWSGRAYWYALVPFHVLIFKQLCQRLADAAEQVEHEDARPAEVAPGGAEPA